MKTPTVRQADIDRALKALKANGESVARIQIRPGEVLIIPGLPEAPPTEHVDALAEWRVKKDARRAAQGA